MKKVLAAVLAVAFLFAGSNLVVAQTALSDSDIQIWGNASILAAAGNMFSDVEDVDRQDKDTTDYRIDLYLSKTFENDGKLVLRLRGGNAGTVALGAYRANINDASNSDNFDVKELWYLQPFFDNLVSIQFGKFGGIDSSNKLGGVSAFFNNDATIATPGTTLKSTSGSGNPFTVKVVVNPIDILTVSYSYSSNYDDGGKDVDGSNQFTSNGYNAVEVNVKAIENGNYRIGYWSNNTLNGVYKDGEIDASKDKEGSSGLWLSFDQKVIDPLTLFARFGLRLDETNNRDNYNPAFTTTFVNVGPAGQVWQFGGLLSGSLWSRDADSVFLAVGQANNIKAALDETYTETHVEFNYNFALSNAVTISPFAQYVQGDADKKIFTGYAYGIKTGYKF